jgi:hypothetical protein
MTASRFWRVGVLRRVVRERMWLAFRGDGGSGESACLHDVFALICYHGVIPSGAVCVLSILSVVCPCLRRGVCDVERVCRRPHAMRHLDGPGCGPLALSWPFPSRPGLLVAPCPGSLRISTCLVVMMCRGEKKVKFMGGRLTHIVMAPLSTTSQEAARASNPG